MAWHRERIMNKPSDITETGIIDQRPMIFSGENLWAETGHDFRNLKKMEELFLNV